MVFDVYLIGCISTAGGTVSSWSRLVSRQVVHPFGCAAPPCVDSALPPAAVGAEPQQAGSLCSEKASHPPDHVLAVEMLKVLSCQTCVLTRDVLTLQCQWRSLIFPWLLSDRGVQQKLTGQTSRLLQTEVSSTSLFGEKKAKKAWHLAGSLLLLLVTEKLTLS